MINVVGVLFHDSSKIYYFSINNIEIKKDRYVIVETERGEQCGLVTSDVFEVDPTKLSFILKPVLRLASEKDIEKHKSNIDFAVKAIEDANKLIKELNLNMKILNANFTFDRKQLLFNFLADDRVDFRVLAKKLAGIYKTRIELRQIGVRDKAREVGGLGQCGRKLCCSVFLNDINSVSINAAKNQNLALNPQKINGACGRLMCCLTYENSEYYELRKKLPKVGQTVSTNSGDGKVIDLDLLAGKYKVMLADDKVIEVGDKK